MGGVRCLGKVHCVGGVHCVAGMHCLRGTSALCAPIGKIPLYISICVLVIVIWQKTGFWSANLSLKTKFVSLQEQKTLKM